MSKPRVIIADTDENYIAPLQLKFIREFFEQIELEIITDKEYFDELFMRPQKADILIVSDLLYSMELKKHNITRIIVMMEQYEDYQIADIGVVRIFKYTSIKEIFNEIIGNCKGIFNVGVHERKETQIVLVTSANGGAGKTTVAMGISAALTKSYKRVLYVNAASLQSFQHLLDNPAVITESDIYTKLANCSDNIYYEIKHLIRKELFNYLPPFKAALLSLGLSYSVFKKIILSAQRSGEYDFIIVDGESAFDEEKAELMSLSNKVILVTNQTVAAIAATNLLISNINGINAEKYIFICNDFDKEKHNLLLSSETALKFKISDYIEHFQEFDSMKVETLSEQATIQKTAFLVM